MMPPGLQAILLAAGGSSRFGSPKQLAHVHGRPMLSHAITTLLQLGRPDSIIVVLGANADVLEPLASAAGVTSVVNPGYAQGVAGSIRAGMAALRPDCRGVLIALADQVGVTADDLRRLVNRWLQRPEGIAAALYSDVAGAPAIFPAALIDELAALQGDRGARDLLRRHPDQVSTLAMPNAAADVDTPADLAGVVQRD